MMKQKIAGLLVLIFLFAIGFWGSGWLVGSARDYQAGSKQNPLASKSYLEEAVEDEFSQMLERVEDLADRVDALQQMLQK